MYSSAAVRAFTAASNKLTATAYRTPGYSAVRSNHRSAPSTEGSPRTAGWSRWFAGEDRPKLGLQLSPAHRQLNVYCKAMLCRGHTTQLCKRLFTHKSPSCGCVQLCACWAGDLSSAPPQQQPVDNSKEAREGRIGLKK
jgi:hypothetical protein